MLARYLSMQSGTARTRRPRQTVVPPRPRLGAVTQAKKDNRSTINVTLEVLIVRRETDAFNHTKDYEETIQFRVLRIHFGGFQSRVRREFPQLTTSIKRMYTRNITCDTFDR